MQRFSTIPRFRQLTPAPAERVDLFMKRNDTSLWAIKNINGRPLRAIGPLSADYLRSPNRLNWNDDGIDARSWGMGDFVLVASGQRMGRR